MSVIVDNKVSVCLYRHTARIQSKTLKKTIENTILINLIKLQNI